MKWREMSDMSSTLLYRQGSVQLVCFGTAMPGRVNSNLVLWFGGFLFVGFFF